jgi:hypothetical protein
MGTFGLPQGEASRRLVDLQEHIHQKRGRVKVDRLAAPGAGGEVSGQLGPGAGGVGGGGEAGEKPGFVRGGLGRGLASRAEAGEAGEEEVDQGDDQVEGLGGALGGGKVGEGKRLRAVEPGQGGERGGSARRKA